MQRAIHSITRHNTNYIRSLLVRREGCVARCEFLLLSGNALVDVPTSCLRSNSAPYSDMIFLLEDAFYVDKSAFGF
jgi:hypothetical protein